MVHRAAAKIEQHAAVRGENVRQQLFGQFNLKPALVDKVANLLRVPAVELQAGGSVADGRK